MTAKKKAEQPSLFGKVDEVYNALETERTYIVDEIKDCNKAIDRKKAVIRILDQRKLKLDGAIKTVRAQRDEYKIKEPEIKVSIETKKSKPKPEPKPEVKPKPKSESPF